jgi:tetratricopeptide (TPR) repeat protein
MSPMKLLAIQARRALVRFLVLLVCTELLAAEPSLEKARRLLSSGSLQEAEVMLRQMIRTDPNRADAHILLGEALALEGIRDESIAQLTEAVRLRPNSANAHNQLGVALGRFVEIKAARKEFETALALDANLVEAHVNLSLILAQAGEFGPAGEHLDRAIALQPNSRAAAYAHYLRAKVWGAQDQIQKSIAELQKAVQLRPDYAEAWSDLGGMRRLALDDVGAVQALERAVGLRPDDALAQYRLGQLYLQGGQAPKAVAHLQQALSYAPDDRATLYNLMLALRKTGRLEEAKPIEERMAELQNQSDHASEVGLAASGLNSEGIQLEKSGDIRAALAKYRAALDLDPTGFGFRLNYALALCRLGRWQDGVVELREVLRLDPDNADAAKALYIANEEADSQSRHVR